MSTTYQSPELAPKRPEIKGGAAIEAQNRVETIRRAVSYVMEVTEGVEIPAIEVTPTYEVAPQVNIAQEDPRMDAALAAVEAAHRSVNPEAGISSIGA